MVLDFTLGSLLSIALKVLTLILCFAISSLFAYILAFLANFASSSSKRSPPSKDEVSFFLVFTNGIYIAVSYVYLFLDSASDDWKTFDKTPSFYNVVVGGLLVFITIGSVSFAGVVSLIVLWRALEPRVTAILMSLTGSTADQDISSSDQKEDKPSTSVQQNGSEDFEEVPNPSKKSR